jgi:hypothetical protein
MTTLLQQIVTTWRTVDLDDLRISQPMVTPTQFMPTIDMMAGFGLSPTADDLLSNQYLIDAISDLSAWTTLLQTPGTSIAQINAAADQFNTRAGRLYGLSPSIWGGVNNRPQITRLLTQEIPAFFDALTNQYALLTGLPTDTPAFPFAMRVPGGVSRTAANRQSGDAVPHALAEQVVTVAVQMTVDKIMDAASQAYNNAKQFAMQTLGYAAFTAGAVAVTAQLKSFVQGQNLDGVVAGASQSFMEFQSAPSWIETPADNDPANDMVFMIGPDLFTQILAAGTDFTKNLKNGYSLGQNAVNNSGRYVNANQIKNDLSQFVKAIKKIKTSFTNLNNVVAAEAKLFMQSPNQVSYGCIFDSSSACRELVYTNGFQPVYSYDPPPGFKSIGGLPVAIIMIVFNKATGDMYFGTPEFLPCSLNDAGTQVTCPNNPPMSIP